MRVVFPVSGLDKFDPDAYLYYIVLVVILLPASLLLYVYYDCGASARSPPGSPHHPPAAAVDSRKNIVKPSSNPLLRSLTQFRRTLQPLPGS